MRLRCRAHNQYAAECTYGAGFMQRRREAAGARKAAAAPGADLMPYLQRLGCSMAVARQAAATSASIPNAPIEQRLRLALQQLWPAGVRRGASVAGPG